MRMVYMGLLETVFNWVWNKILSPIVEFLANILGAVLEWIFNTILVPILTLVLKTVLPWVIDLLMDVLSEVFYGLLSWIFKIVDYMSIAFDIFVGAADVEYNNMKMPLLNSLLSQPAVTKAFWLINALGLGIAMLLCIYAVMKSTLDFDFENKRPVGAVLRSMFKCFVTFLLIPFFVLLMINLAGIVMKGIQTAFDSQSDSKAGSLGCILFSITSLDAATNEKMNISYVPAAGESQPYENLLTASTRGDFYTGTYSYMDVENVKKYFVLKDFDYLVGIIIGIFLLLAMAICAVSFIQRIFEILILYLSSPLFVSTMPLDDGEKFGKWREMFIGKTFGAYGSLIAMKLYLMLCPVIVDNSIQWGSAQTSPEASYFIKLIFLAGGAWAMMKVGPMLTSILSAQAGQDAQASQMQTMGMIHSAGRSVRGYAASAAHMTSGAFRGAKQKRAMKKEEKNAIGDQKMNSLRKSMREDSEKAYKGSLSKGAAAGQKPGGATSEAGGARKRSGVTIGTRGAGKPGAAAWKKGTAGGERGKSGVTIGAERPEVPTWKNGTASGERGKGGVTIGAERPGAAAWKNGTAGGERGKGGITIGAERAAEESHAWKAGAVGGSAGAADTGSLESRAAEGSEAFTGDTAAGVPKLGDGDFGYGTRNDGSDVTPGSFDRAAYFMRAHVPSAVSSKEDGSFSYGIGAFKVQYNAQGQRTGYKLPFVNLKYDSQGKIRVNKVNIPHICTVQREGQNGRFQVRDIPAIGFHQERMPNGGFGATSAFGFQLASQYNAKTGENEIAGVRIGNKIFNIGTDSYRQERMLNEGGGGRKS